MLVGSLQAALRFYHDILGFEEFWRGGAGPELSWVNMRVPDGEDYVEFMLYRELPAPDARGVRNHISLMVPDVKKAAAALEARPARKSYFRAFDVKIGVNQKWQANFFDPDGTRVELMEPKTFNGKSAPSSTAPPPVPLGKSGLRPRNTVECDEELGDDYHTPDNATGWHIPGLTHAAAGGR